MRRFDLSFRVRHPVMAAEDVCAQIGMKAKTAWTAGANRRSPSGQELPGKYEETYCSFPLDARDDETIADCLYRHATELHRRVADLQMLTRSGGELEFFVGWYMEKNDGEVLAAPLMTLLSRINAGVSLDVYPGPLRQREAPSKG